MRDYLLSAALGVLLLAGCPGKTAPPANGGALSVELSFHHSESSMDSHSSTETYTLKGKALKRTEEHSGYRPSGSEPAAPTRAKLTDEQYAEIVAFLESSKLLSDYEATYKERSPAPSFSRSETASVEIQWGDKSGSVIVRSGTGRLAEGEEETSWNDDEYYADLTRLRGHFNSALGD